MIHLKRITSFCLVCLLLTVLCLPVRAESGGSIRVSMTREGEVVSGGSLTLYRVADAENTLTEPFQNCGVALDLEEEPRTAKALADYAAAEEIQGDTRPVGADGSVLYEDLECGLYLLVQWESAPGYACISPFLVHIPMSVGLEAVYHVDAGPKLAPTPEPTEPAPTQPWPDDPKLPQTGQLNWPVPVLGGAGLILLAMGCRLSFRRKKDGHEE